jgi:hypothetical protein
LRNGTRDPNRSKHQYGIQQASFVGAQEINTMISRTQDGEIVFHAIDDRDELVSALKEILTTTEIGQLYKKDFYTKARADEDAEKLVSAAMQIAGGTMISSRHLEHALDLLITSGEVKTKNLPQAAQLEEPEPDTRPRGRDGKVLTESQLRYQEYRVWSETASSDERKRRMSSDPNYASYVRKAYQAEMDQEIGGSVTPLGQPTKKARTSKDIEAFAQKFLVEPSSNLRPKNGMVSLGGELIPWNTFQDLLNKATAAGAI